jgi:hypothetical protein
MFHLKRFLLGSIGVSLLACLLFTTHTTVPSIAHANGCNTVAEGYHTKFSNSWPDWSNNCTVSEGNISNFVYAIQLVLNESGTNDPQTGNTCNAGTPDGNFGQNTYNAVVCFQKAMSLSPDGIVGPQTWNALSNDVNGPVNSSEWNYFHGMVDSNTKNYRMWGQSPFKWYVNAGGCWRQITVNSSSCA